MRIDSVHVEKFGKLQGFDLQFSPGLTVIYGANESGKTTLAAFIRAMLYGMNGKSASVLQNDRRKYMPWNDSCISGRLRLADGRTVYEITRIFGQTRKSDVCTVVDTSTGERVPIPVGEEPGQVLLGVEESVFLDTLYVSAKGSRISGDGAALGERIRNCIGTGAEDVDLNRLLERLQTAKSAIAPRVRDRGKLAEVQKELDEVRAKQAEGRKCAQETERLEKEICAWKKSHAAVQDHASERRRALQKSEAELMRQLQELEWQLGAEEARETAEKRRKRRIAAVWFAAGMVTAVVSIALGAAVNEYAYWGLTAAAALAAGGVVRLISGTGRRSKDSVDVILAKLSQLRQDQAMLWQQRSALDGLKNAKETETPPTDHDEELIRLYIALEKAKQMQAEQDGLRARAESLEAQEKQLTQTVRALEMAQEELREAARERQENLAPEIVRNMEALLCGVTAGKYERAAVSRELVLSVQSEREGLRSWEYFSAGTVEQMYLALRLSLVRVLNRTAGALPVLLDDPLAQYDDERARDALALLQDFASEDQQVLLFTCRERETRGMHCVRM